MYRVLIRIVTIMIRGIRIPFKTKDELILENLALRQQLASYQIKKEKPNISDVDRLFWVALQQTWTKWKDALVIVKPATVVNWQKKRFKKHWTKISCRKGRPGRKPISKEIQNSIYRMTSENNWGAPRVYSELLMLGYEDVSQPTVSRYLRKIRVDDPGKKQKQQSCRTFLKNHRDGIAAMDFFVVPTVRFKLLYVFFIIDHAKRKIIHLNITLSPTSEWVLQQLRDAFPFDTAPKHLIFDRDKIFSFRIRQFIKEMGTKPKQTSYQSPWQNGVAERWVLSARAEILNHVITLNEEHLRRLLKHYVNYYNQDRCHLSLNRDTPEGRMLQKRFSESAKVVSLPRLGGLQHRYEWREAA